MGDKIRKVKWFWAWQDEQEEAWLRDMSQKGMHLAGIGGPGVYWFEARTPLDVVYRLDYRSPTKVERQEYLQLFEDAGWERVGELGGWQYFRKPAEEGGVDEIYTDTDSKVAKYQRLLFFLMLLYLVLFVLFITVVRDWDFSPWAEILRIIYAGLIVFYSYAMVRIFMRMNQLKKL